MSLKINTLGKKIALGYVLMALLLALAVAVTIFQVKKIGATADNLVDLHHPSSKASIEVMNGVNHSIAAIRGWILLKKDTFKNELDYAWETEIRKPLAQLETLSKEWTNQENLVLLSKLKPLIENLYKYHQEVMELAVSDPESAVELLEARILGLNQEIREIISQLTIAEEHLTLQSSKDIQDQIGLLNSIEWILFFAGLFIGFSLAVLITRSVTAPIENAVKVAQDIGSGNLDMHVNVGGSKEMEVLGSALIAMQHSLKKKTLENQQYDWLTSGQNKLSQIMRGDKEIEELANEIITFMANYMDARIGALYLINEAQNMLQLSGRYAFSSGETFNNFKIGDGLVGQAAANKQPILLEELEEKHIRVQSSFVDAAPHNILVSPFLFQGKVLGVIELGKLSAFDEPQKEFVEYSMESIGIALNSAISRKKIQELLEETQRQSEELQQQQEELEQNNEELEEQTQKLKEQQEELQATNEELEEQAMVIEQKNQNLESAKTDIELKAKQLEISSKYKSEFLANMSHELRTPLNSLLILSNDLVHNKEGNLNEEQIESAEVISKSGQDLLNLINEILDLSKIESGKMDLNISEINVGDLANDLNRNFGKQANAKGLKMETSIDETLPETIHTDKQRLDQILKNLISNALKFTESGKIKVIFMRDVGNYLSIAVKDSGIGIPKNKQDVIFEAFQQADGGTARKYGGTGLGLSISRELAKLLGGKITLESRVGEGSTFTVFIPIHIIPEEILTPQPKKINKKTITIVPDNDRYINYASIDDERNMISGEDQSILIIEDDNDFAQILARQARNKGFKYLAAATGEDGLILAQTYRPSAIILDLTLPGIDGHMVLKELKANPDLRHIPVHIVSANEKSLDPIKSGAIEYLSKPVTKEQLNGAFARIEDFISRKMKNLLIIEDNANLRKSIVKLIGNGDVKCFEAGTGTEAIDFFKKHPVDCMVLDIGLPDMSGFELINRLEKENKDIPPIIIYTGRELSKKETEELQQHAETIIIKGVKSEERLLDETALFLHRAVKNLPKQKQDIITELYNHETVFHGKQLLLVDDDMRNVFALSKVLKEKGLNIIKAENGVVALQALEKNPEIDLVLMDIMMPEMDGYECMQKIRSQKIFQDLPVIALTAKAMKEDRQKCIDAGANDYITKPVDLERLLSLMRVWIKK